MIRIQCRMFRLVCPSFCFFNVKSESLRSLNHWEFDWIDDSRTCSKRSKEDTAPCLVRVTWSLLSGRVTFCIFSDDEDSPREVTHPSYVQGWNATRHTYAMMRVILSSLPSLTSVSPWNLDLVRLGTHHANTTNTTTTSHHTTRLYISLQLWTMDKNLNLFSITGPRDW